MVSFGCSYTGGPDLVALIFLLPSVTLGVSSGGISKSSLSCCRGTAPGPLVRGFSPIGFHALCLLFLPSRWSLELPGRPAAGGSVSPWGGSGSAPASCAAFCSGSLTFLLCFPLRPCAPYCPSLSPSLLVLYVYSRSGSCTAVGGVGMLSGVVATHLLAVLP